MGCAASNLDDLDAVKLCRDRSHLLADAITFRYQLADSTAAYSRSLRSAGASLHDFLSILPTVGSAPSPLLSLPVQRKGDAVAVPVQPVTSNQSHSHSRSGSHIHFSDEDSEEDDSVDGDEDGDSHIHSTDSSPIHHTGHTGQHQFPPPGQHQFQPGNSQFYNQGQQFYPGYDQSQFQGQQYYPGNDQFYPGQPHVTYNYARSKPPPAATVSVQPPAVHYARNTPAPAVVHERRQRAPEAVNYGGGGGSDPYPPPYYGHNPNPYPYPDPEQSSGSGYGYTPYPTSYAAAYGGGGFFGGPASPPPNIPPPRSPAAARAPPPPPSPPKASTWDFLNPFGAYERYTEDLRYPYTPSRSSKEVRDEEGIPDLEDEHEVVKEAYGDSDSKFSSASASTSPELSGKTKKGDGSGKTKKSGEEGHYESGEASSSSAEGKGKGNVVDKDVVAGEAKHPGPHPEPEPVTQQRHNVGAVAAATSTRYHDLSEVVTEIKAQFERASVSFDEVSRMLEVGKKPYKYKTSVIGVSARMMCGLSSSSNTKDQFLEFEEEKAMGSGNLSSTLRKLYLWELKLLDEVKVEEKMRIVLERECEHLRRLDEKGAETQKIESTQMFIRNLSTKIRMAIKVVESVSNKISKLRDEELWPQINEFIQGMMRLWRVMLECHQIQCRAISDATVPSGGRLSDAHIEATKRLELELLDLMTCFSTWVAAQKNFVKALNGWLMKGLRIVPEVTDDGIVPFSPGRLGAPPMFVICNYWSQTIDRISEAEAIDAMKGFASNVLSLWQQHNFEQRQRLMANKDMDKTLRVVEMEEQQMRKAVEAQNKRLELVSGQSGLTLSGQLHHDHTVEFSTLHSNLRQFFEAMENFTATSFKAYEELHMRAEEEKLANRNSRT